MRQSIDNFRPHYLSVHATTWLLPDKLQRSILGLWLTASQMGIAPTYFQTISSDRMHAAALAFVSGIARHSKHRFYRHGFYSVKRLISSMTSTVNFTPTVSPFFMNRESHENRERFDHANHSPLQWITTIWTLFTKAVHYKQCNVGFATFIVHQHSPLFLTQKTGSVIRHH